MSSRQDKATTERNARILRELVKRPDNKACADCRKNDARWASWNLGVYLCIRCSGIHRSMGTHISKVKSIDLDMWTPEQMENIQKWGNRRANAYWERHLKAGHIPPEHKIESFIRSKYESRRWAMDGPLPRDPSVLDDLSQSQAQAGGEASAPAPAPTQSKPARAAPTATSTSAPPRSAGAPRHPLLSRPQARAKPAPAAPAPIIDLFGDDSPAPPTPAPVPAASPVSTTSAQPASASTSPAATSPQPPAASNMFDLDFKAPSPPPQKAATAKADIMSLFAQQPSPASASSNFGGGAFFNASAPSPQTAYASWNGGITASNPPTAQATAAPVPTWGFEQAAWGSPGSQPQTQPPQQQQPHSAGFGSFTSANTSGSGFGGPSGVGGLTHTLGSLNMGGAATSPQKSSGSGLWGNDPWAAPAPAPAPAQKKDERDPFANIWS